MGADGTKLKISQKGEQKQGIKYVFFCNLTKVDKFLQMSLLTLQTLFGIF